jgi:hypothetical protein
LLELGVHLARVLEHAAAFNRDMLEPEADHRSIPHPGKQKQSHQGLIATLDIGGVWHGEQRGAVLFERGV